MTAYLARYFTKPQVKVQVLKIWINKFETAPISEKPKKALVIWRKPSGSECLPPPSGCETRLNSNKAHHLVSFLTSQNSIAWLWIQIPRDGDGERVGSCAFGGPRVSGKERDGSEKETGEAEEEAKERDEAAELNEAAWVRVRREELGRSRHGVEIDTKEKLSAICCNYYFRHLIEWN